MVRVVCWVSWFWFRWAIWVLAGMRLLLAFLVSG